MKISAEIIKKFRDETGAGMMDCKKFLNAALGDYKKAIELLRKEGQKIASKKSERTTKNGLIDSYIHPGNRVGVLIEVSCETDFVALNKEFKELVHDLAMHIAAFNPKYLAPADVPKEIVDGEIAIYREQLKSEKKPEAIINKIIDGKMAKYYEETCLMKQKFLKDDSKTIEAFLTEKIAKIGENIQIKNYIRYSL